MSNKRISARGWMGLVDIRYSSIYTYGPTYLEPAVPQSYSFHMQSIAKYAAGAPGSDKLPGRQTDRKKTAGQTCRNSGSLEFFGILGASVSGKLERTI